MYSLVIVHEDGATISVCALPYDAAKTESVVYAHYSNDINYRRANSYNRPKD